MKKILMTLALLCTVAVGTWAEDVKYLYYKVIAVGNQASLSGHTGTATNPTALTSTLLVNSNEDNLDTGWYVLNSSFTYGERIVISGDVHLILCDGCTLTAQQGIRINTDATLTIYAQSIGNDMGKIVATETNHDKAAIGGNKNYRAGELVIHGGNIEASCNDGSKYAAGIGGGYGDGSGMKAITIYSGKVTAKGALYGAGIGGGKNNDKPGTITIYGGTINATGGDWAAGIGGGENRAGWDTNVYGGNITAQGGHYGAGIGGGESGKGGNLHFYGGTVNAIGGDWASGIGGGENGDGGTTIIDGGNITATGKFSGPGIGCGSTNNPPHGRKSGTVTINGGTVVATGSAADGNTYSGAGIGTGYNGTVEKITITGGHVEAYGKCGSAGIGGGNFTDGMGVINISGGTIYAEGGFVTKEEYYQPEGGFNDNYKYEHYSGAGIGGSSNATGSGEINISGTADIHAVGALGAAAIGVGNKVPWYGSAKLNISITGGHIRAQVNKEPQDQEGGHELPMLIGVGVEVKDRNITITIADGLSVWAGDDADETSVQNYSDRVAVCKGRGYSYGDINTHTEHGAYNYTLGDFPAEHVPHCGYCGKTLPAERHTNDGTGKCEQCGYDAHVHTVKVYQTTGSGMGYGEGTVLASVIPGQNVALPDIKQSSLPAYMAFEGWLQDPATAPDTWEKQDGETLLMPGTLIRPAANVNLYARYSYQYGTEWTWTASSKTASATLYIINLQNNSVVETVVFGDDERMLISAKSILPTDSEPGSVMYSAEVNYTDEQGRSFVFTDNHTVTTYLDVSLDEDDNTTTLNNNDGSTVTATLTGRTLYKDGSWNTLCLPFDVAIEGSPLEGATLKELTDAAFDSSTGTLTLTFADATSIEAGRAYLIKWASGTNLGPADLVFTGVTLSQTLREDEITADVEGTASVTFMGTYKKRSFEADDPTVLYLGADNQLYYPQNGATIGAQRAYFQLSGLTAGEASPNPSQEGGNAISAFALNFGDGETTTGMIEAEANSSLFTLHSSLKEGWYSLDGRRLSGKPTAPGLYINNGKKHIIK